jgi:hypothetical protein
MRSESERRQEKDGGLGREREREDVLFSSPSLVVSCETSIVVMWTSLDIGIFLLS